MFRDLIILSGPREPVKVAGWPGVSKNGRSGVCDRYGKARISVGASGNDVLSKGQDRCMGVQCPVSWRTFHVLAGGGSW